MNEEYLDEIARVEDDYGDDSDREATVKFVSFILKLLEPYSEEFPEEALRWKITAERIAENKASIEEVNLKSRGIVEYLSFRDEILPHRVKSKQGAIAGLCGA